jgi:hypothetical protein
MTWLGLRGEEIDEGDPRVLMVRKLITDTNNNSMCWERDTGRTGTYSFGEVYKSGPDMNIVNGTGRNAYLYIRIHTKLSLPNQADETTGASQKRKRTTKIYEWMEIKAPKILIWELYLAAKRSRDRYVTSIEQERARLFLNECKKIN